MIKLPIINRIFPSYKSKIIAVIVTGVIVGGGVLFMYMLRAHTYLGDDGFIVRMPGMLLVMTVMFLTKTR